MSSGKMSLSKLSFAKMSFGKMSFGKMSFDVGTIKSCMNSEKVQVWDQNLTFTDKDSFIKLTRPARGTGKLETKIQYYKTFISVIY